MHCWVGGEVADGICRFCGRAVCKKHAQSHPYVLETWLDGTNLRGLAVEDALWCGVCKVPPSPLDMNFLKRENALRA